jgi:hypothetical protein
MDQSLVEHHDTHCNSHFQDRNGIEFDPSCRASDVAAGSTTATTCPLTAAAVANVDFTNASTTCAGECCTASIFQ